MPPAPTGPVLPTDLVFARFTTTAELKTAFDQPTSNRGGGFGGGFGGKEEIDTGTKILLWEKDPQESWHTTIRRDEIEWGPWRAAYAIERSMREGGEWRECVRVNLDQRDRHLLLYAPWPDGEHVDLDILRRILRSLKMLEPEEDR